MATFPPVLDPSPQLHAIRDRVAAGTLPSAAGDFATAALAQVAHLHLVIEEMEVTHAAADGPEELLADIAAEARRWLHPVP